MFRLNSSLRKLKVWHIAEMYPPDYGGGAAIYIRDVCRFLAERGHEVRVLCTEAANSPPYTVRTEYDGPVRVDRLNLPYFRTEDPGGWRLGVRGWRKHQQRVARVADELLKEWLPNIVQFHTPYTVIEECLPSIQHREIPVVGMAHCAWLICPRLRLMRSPTSSPCEGPSPLRCLECLYSHWDGSHAKAMLKLPWRIVKLGAFPAYRLRNRYTARQKVNGLVAYSKFMADVHRGHVNGLVEHVPLGIDMTGLPSERPRRPRTPLRFGFAGGFQSHKGIWDVLDAAASLKCSGLMFELHIWGPNQETGPVAERDLEDRVVLHGMFAPEDRWSVFFEMDILLMATRDAEPYGRVIQEAAAAGAPSIAPNVAGISEQIRDGVDGLLYEFRDRRDLERQMMRVIDEPGLVGELARNLWPVVDTREAVANIEDFYFRVLGGAAAQSPALAQMSSG